MINKINSALNNWLDLWVHFYLENQKHRDEAA